MTNEEYQHRLERLREAVVAIGDLVCNQLETAVAALYTCDRSLARDVIDADREVNRRSLTIERECLEVIALHQPVASDLRIVVAAFKIATDFERVGDLATNLARYALDSNDCGLPDADFERISALAQEMLGDAIDAFVTNDTDACFAIAQRDDELDVRAATVNERVIRRLLELTAGSGGPPPAVFEDVSQTLLIVRDLERIGDHAVNVAGRTLYALENDAVLLA